MRRALSGFQTFVLRGNVVDLAIGVVIGAAFTNVVTSVVRGLITPLIGLFGKGNLDGYVLHVGRSGRHIFAYGEVLTALINFLLVAAVLYLFVVQPVNTLLARFRTQAGAPTPTRPCPECLSSVPRAARRCAFCTTPLSPASDPLPAGD